jgi:hypothetical protein
MLPVLSQSEADLTACFVQDIAALLDSFSEKETSGKQSLQQMLSSDRAAFSRASIQVLGQTASTAGARYLLHLLRKHNLLMAALIDPRGSKREIAMAAARKIPQIGAPVEADLEKVLSASLGEPRSPENAARVLRLLELLEVSSTQPRYVLYQADLLRYPDPVVRSRAALLIARHTKSTALVSRLLLDNEPRVQANAVEALWTFDPADALPLLVTVGRSKNARIAANAAVGLYRCGDLSSLKLMFGMAQEADSGRRTSAAWAMGETGDPRFLPFLTTWFPTSSGNEKVNVLQALGRIRRREKALAETGTIEIQTWDARIEGASRHLVLTLRSPDKPDLSAFRPTEFAIWEGTTLIEDYEISAHPNPLLAIYGFVLPRFSSIADPYGNAVLEGIDRCLKHKRVDDIWRLDRYLLEPRTGAPGPAIEKSGCPYDEAVLGAYVKIQQRGFLAVPEALKRIVETPGPKERAADDVVAAFDRHSDAMIKFSGKRRLFLFLSEDCDRRMERHVARLTSFLANERITLHGIAPKGAGGCEEFQKLCQASEGGSFSAVAVAEVAREVERIYAQTINRFDVTYRVPGEAQPEPGRLQIAGHSGCGRASFQF